MKELIKKTKNYFLKHHRRAIKQKASPHSIAMGFALGTFVAVFPTFGLGLLIVLFIMIFYKTMNKIAAIAGLAFWNIFMMGPIFYLSPKIGKFVINEFGLEIAKTELRFKEIITTHPINWHDLFEFLRVYAQDYLIGNTILSILISVICYFIIKMAVIDYRILKEKRLEKKLKAKKLNKK